MRKQTREENLKAVYILHLINNDLEDDSDDLTPEEIEEFVFLHIDEEDRKWYECVPKNDAL